MTKAELIRIIAKRSGVPDQETKIFFELFLQKAASNLNRGEAIKIKGLGYFQLRQGVIKDAVDKTKGNLIYSDLMVYFPIKDDELNSEESLIFNVPLQSDEEYNEADSYFSLSIGRPVIPMEGPGDMEFFIPPTGHELRKLIETKVEKLLNGAEIIDKYIKGNEVLIIEAEKHDAQYELDWNEKKQSAQYDISKNNESDSGLKNTSEFEHLAWDFGEDLSRQIEEEAILDSAGIEEQPSEKISEEELAWDFGVPEIDEEKEKPTEEENTIEDENNYGRFERVKSITTEFTDSDINKKKKNLTWNFGNTDKNTNEEETFVFNQDEDEILPEITIDEDKSEDNISEDAELQNKLTETSSEIKEEKKEDNRKPENVNDESNNQQKEDRITKVKHRQYTYSRNRSPLVFVIALTTIIAVGVVLYIFMMKGSLTMPWDNGEGKNVKIYSASTPEIINRDYKVPVTYPYPNKNAGNPGQSGTSTKEIQTNKIDARVKSKSNLSALLKSSKKKKSVYTTPTLPKSALKTTNIHDNIYKTSAGYIVQVSSWQSSFVAHKEAEKYSRKGYKSFVEKAKIPGRGTWYRVRVGNFKTIVDAQNFINKNQ